MAKGWRKANAKKRRPSYPVWAQMIQRCTNPRVRAYKDYGGRGITVCDKWRTFEGFYEDMGDPPPGMTLERIDNDKGYCKENCRWASRMDQAANKRGLRLLTFRGKTQSLRRWAMEVGIGYLTLYTRIVRDGWPVERALTEPVDTSKRNRRAGRREV